MHPCSHALTPSRPPTSTLGGVLTSAWPSARHSPAVVDRPCRRARCWRSRSAPLRPVSPALSCSSSRGPHLRQIRSPPPPLTCTSLSPSRRASSCPTASPTSRSHTRNRRRAVICHAPTRDAGDVQRCTWRCFQCFAGLRGCFFASRVLDALLMMPSLLNSVFAERREHPLLAVAFVSSLATHDSPEVHFTERLHNRRFERSLLTEEV